MKNKNVHSDYLQSRNEQLSGAFRARLGKGWGVLEVFNQMTDVPAPRFYISEERAFRLVSLRRRKGRWPEGIIPTRRRMLNEIYRRVEAMMEADPALDLRDAVFEVVNSPAPSFYLTPGSIRRIIYSFHAQRHG